MSLDNTSGHSACVNARHCCLTTGLCCCCPTSTAQICLATLNGISTLTGCTHIFTVPQAHQKPGQTECYYCPSCTQIPGQTKCYCCPTGIIHLVKLKGISILRALHTLLLSYRCTRNLDRLNIITMNVITVRWVRRIPAHTECCCYPTGIIHLAKLNVTTVFHVHQIAGQIEATAILHTPGQTSKCYHCPPGVTHTWPN